MEAATVLTVAAVRRVRAGAVLTVIDSASEGVTGLPDPSRLPMDAAIECAVGGLRRLIGLDRAGGGEGTPAAH
jgi:uridine phosphorylase